MIPEPKLKDLYQEMILDHNRRPRNFHELPDATHYSHGYNPLCGDDYHIYLKINPGQVLEDVGFQGKGCAISKSSASIMTTLIKGKGVKEAEELKTCFLDFMTKDQVPAEKKAKVSSMKIFEGVKQFPIRVKCATLIWHALEDALKDAGKK